MKHVEAREWDRLLDVDDAPLLSWGYLEGLEQAGCVGEGTSWQPAHLMLRFRDELLAAAPAYLKTDSDGEWVYDLDWAKFAERIGGAYYPKLVIAVPFNPVGGSRVLMPCGLPEAERTRRAALLLGGAQALLGEAGLSSLHVLFPREDQVGLLTAAGFAPRTQEQYHFLNEGYTSFEDFLGRMRAHRRSTIRRERRALKEAGISVSTHRGLGPDGFTRADLDLMYDMYHQTSVRYTGGAPYLNRRFFHLCAERLGDRLELVLARDRAGEILAGAFNLRGDRRLFGRHWGEAKRIPFLHFEVCYYHSVERCIREGLTAFEPGHGGEHKLVRGFQPVLTHSAHYLAEPGLRQPVERYLQMEASLVVESMAAARARCPLRPARATKRTAAGGRRG